MIRPILGRLAEAAVALLLMSLLIFLLSRVTGDPIALLLSDDATEADRLDLIRQLNLDRPLWEQYFSFLGNALQGDFGRSVAGGQEDALKVVLERIPASLSLAGVALTFTLALGIVLGVLASITRGTPADVLIRLVALIGQSVPSFWLGIMLIYLVSVHWGLLPTSGVGTWKHYVLPALTLGLFTLAAVTRLVRASMLDALGSEYVKLARIKGVSEATVVLRHALANSLIPVVTFMGTFFATMITGAVVVETVFAWPGIGRLAFEAILSRDFPVIQTVVLVITAFFILANLIVDMLYLAIDPRMRGRG
jgi:peptide/nickel transport system permease protein